LLLAIILNKCNPAYIIGIKVCYYYIIQKAEGVKVMKIKTFLCIGAMFLLSSIVALAALDLAFTTAITMSPSPANAGDLVQFTVSFKTNGGAVTNLKIIGGIDGTQLFERTYASILADKTKTDLFTWTATGGAHTAWFELDPDHTCGDSNYTNNRKEKAITIGGGPAGQPNLKPTVTYTPTNFNAGDAVAFTIRVNNNGTAASVASVMKVKKAGAAIQTFNVAAINAGDHIDKAYNWTAECDAALSVEVDTGNSNAESNEGDNIWSHTMACGDEGGVGPIAICIPCWRLYEIPKFRIPIPDPCGDCPPWHEGFEKGDPIDVLTRIGNKLGEGASFDDIKGDWALFLNNHHGLNPNFALKFISEQAVAGGKAKFRNKLGASKFQEGLNLTIGQLANIAESELVVR
jgi:hypothetical protein